MPRMFLDSVSATPASRPGLEAVHELTLLRDRTNPFIGQHVSLREHCLIQVPKGPSMLEEKLACPMEDAAHERQVLTAQQGSSASTFLNQHVSIVARTIDIMEKMFLDAEMMFYERTHSIPSDSTDPAGFLHHRTDLLYLGNCTVGAEKSYSDQILESDLEDLVQGDSVDIISPAEERLLLEQFRQRRIRHYRQGPAGLRVNKRIATIAAARVSSKAGRSSRDLPKSSAGL
jgi:hypothetical protein